MEITIVCTTLWCLGPAAAGVPAPQEAVRETAYPYRVGKPLHEIFDGYHLARRGTYRINEDKRTVEIHSIRHRRDAYHT